MKSTVPSVEPSDTTMTSYSPNGRFWFKTVGKVLAISSRRFRVGITIESFNLPLGCLLAPQTRDYRILAQRDRRDIQKQVTQSPRKLLNHQAPAYSRTYSSQCAQPGSLD